MNLSIFTRIATLGGVLAIMLPAYVMPTNAQEVPAVEQTQFKAFSTDNLNERYCEIIPVFKNGLTLRAEIYNTIGLNDCPADKWQVLDGETLKKAYGAKVVEMNGPRFWTMNKINSIAENNSDKKVVDFGGIEMRQQAIIEFKPWNQTLGKKYKENKVKRYTTYHYNKGTMVYELTSSNGDVYRMQSYSQIVDPELKMEDLQSLGNRLKLPEGWSYNARVLAEDSNLKADGLAYVISDDFSNTYQKIR